MSLICISLYAYRTAQPLVLPRRETQNFSKKVVFELYFFVIKYLFSLYIYIYIYIYILHLIDIIINIILILMNNYMKILD